jgi:polysaccharide biosynthesis/export protein
MDAMKTVGPVILLFALLLSAFAEADAQDSVITFYTTDTAGPDSAPIVYSNGQKIGQAIKGQFIRLSVRPGPYQFALTEDAPPTQQFSLSIGGGQEIFLRVTRTAFFIGSAAEANASMRTVTSSAAPAVVPHVAAPAAPRPDPRAQSAQVKQSISSQGIPGVLRCTFSGTLTLHATIQPGSPVVAGVRCGDPVFLIDPSLASTHVRMQDGKEGFILGLNLGQWFIQTEAPERATAGLAPSALPSPTTTRPPVQALPERPADPDLIVPPAAAHAAPADVISPYASRPVPGQDLTAAPASALVPVPDLVVLPTAAVPDPPLVAISLASHAPTSLAILPPVFPPAPPPEPISAFAPAPAPTPDAISPSAPATDTAARDDYLIEPEDVLAISVWGEPNLSTKATVRSDGKISMQFLGDVRASGLTTSLLREYLRNSLSKYLKAPVVSVIVTESHRKMVHVIGRVAKPGSYPLNRPLTVMELLVRAGGFAEFAEQESVIIVRYEGNTASRILFNYKTFVSGEKVEQNILLRNRDLIIVP